MYPAKVNCKSNNDGAWCKNKNIKRSLFGIGARLCTIYEFIDKKCEYQEACPKPKPPSKQGF